MKVNNVIVKPIITEKTSRLTQSNVYAFEVNIKSDKTKVASALKAFYDVEIESIRMFTRKGKEKRIGRSYNTKKQADKKIAYVKVTKGTIDLFPKA